MNAANATLLTQQQALLEAIWSWPADEPNFHKKIANFDGQSSGRGLLAYQSNARMLAQRVLAAAYPVVTAVLSPDSMGQLARALWKTHPPTCGDLTHWGAALPAFVAGSEQLADLPWLADLARLEWTLHAAEAAADVAHDTASWGLLVQAEPSALGLRFAAATQVLPLSWNVHPIWQAHQAPEGDALEQAVQRLGPDAAQWAQPMPSAVLVWRPIHQVRCRPVAEPEATFLRQLLQGQNLLAALEQSDPDWAHWLPMALNDGLLAGGL
jgi:Putative DNA-binding domain